jgi:hypothetical protein
MAVMGASGGIVTALAEVREQGGELVVRLGCQTEPGPDFLDEASIEATAAHMGPGLTLVID